MVSITPHLWFDTEAAEAAALYTSLFEGSRIKSTVTIHNPPSTEFNTPATDAEIVTIDLAGQEFMLLSAGPLFRANPSVSFMVACATAGEVDRLWTALSEGGEELMELGEYPFSDHYGWLQDRYGVSWQLMHQPDGPIGQKITPTLMFVGDVAGRAEEAMRFWTSLFPDAAIGEISRYAGDGPDAAGTVMHAGFTLAGQEFAAMDSAQDHRFAFNEAVSLIVNCATQEEIDHYWNALSADPEAEACGWLKDKFGVSWQVVPEAMVAMLSDTDAERMARVNEAVLGMKKLDIAELQAVYDGRTGLTA